jgi:16S rRNA (guanine1516-N2)-methyltransferase
MTNIYQQPAAPSRVIATAATASEIAAARALATELGIGFTPDYRDTIVQQYDYALILSANYLGLQAVRETKLAPFYIDFLAGKMRYRSDQAGLKRELLARAMGAKPKDQPYIIDATAGLGRDSFILATLGFEITLLERDPIIFALLRDALSRAAADADIAPIVARMHLIHADAAIWLKELAKEQLPDIIYLDPMFPGREKSASVKKEMVILQNLLAKDLNSHELLDIAAACSLRRVVVKRPRLAPTLTERAPNYTLAGKSSRFDIYLV